MNFENLLQTYPDLIKHMQEEYLHIFPKQDHIERTFSISSRKKLTVCMKRWSLIPLQYCQSATGLLAHFCFLQDLGLVTLHHLP